MHWTTKHWVAALVGVGGFCGGLADAQACGGRGSVSVYRHRPAYTAPVAYHAPRQCAPAPQFAPPGQFRAVVQPVAPRPQVGVAGQFAPGQFPPGQPGVAQAGLTQFGAAQPAGQIPAAQGPAQGFAAQGQGGGAPMGLSALGGQPAAVAGQGGSLPGGQPGLQPGGMAPGGAATRPAGPASAAPATPAPMNAAQQSALQALGDMGDSPSAPAETSAAAPPANFSPTGGHIGDWKASVSNGAEVRLSLRADGSFEWVAAQGDKTTSFSGQYTLENGALTLVRSSDNQKLAGALTLSGGGFNFKLSGAKDNGLDFQRG